MMENMTVRGLLGACSPSAFWYEDRQRKWCFDGPHYHKDGKVHAPMSEAHRALCGRPLMRLYDNRTGSQPGDDWTMLARDSRQFLDSYQARRDSLRRHADYSNWKYKTPFISFSATPEAVERHARLRAKSGRGPQTLIVINPCVRAVIGLPTLNFQAEMQHYRITDPYHQDYAYYKDEYLCLWEVTPDEIIVRWDWDEISQYPEWYEKLIMPLYHLHWEHIATIPGWYEDKVMPAVTFKSPNAVAPSVENLDSECSSVRRHQPATSHSYDL